MLREIKSSSLFRFHVRLSAVVSAALAVLSCQTATIAYQGAGRQAAELSILKGYVNYCRGAVKLQNFDGKYSGTRIETLPGSHYMQLHYRGMPYISDDASQHSFAVCVPTSIHTVEFDTQAGRTYWFHVDEVDAGTHVLSVLESAQLSDQAGQVIQSKVVQNKAGRDCYLDDRFSECF